MSVADSGKQEFSGWRAYLWPVHQYELKKLIPMLLIFFLISFDYNVLRAMKDPMVVTAESSGAEVIPFIKVWVMFPGAILMTFLFTRLSNRLSRETVVYVMISLFLVFFFIFTFILYPMRDVLHPNATADEMQKVLPLGFKGFIAMFRNWTYTSFYVMSELWSNIILAMIFWGFANQVTRLGEAKRFYGLFGIGANLSGVAAGLVGTYCCPQKFNPSLPFGTNEWEQSMIIMVSLVLIAGVAALILFRWMNATILSNSLYYDPVEATREKEVKGRLSMRENFKYLFRSKYLISIATIVVAYNLVINLVEVIWKNEINELYPNPNDFKNYMSYVMTLTGVLATLTALFISGNSIRKCGWTFTAMLTPAILLLTSLGFFTFFFMKDMPPVFDMAFLGTTPLALVVFFGSAQNILCRAAKYSVFDATKEMAFVPLSPECKVKGKAAVDGVCSRLGKSGGSVIHQSLLLTFSTFAASAPYVAGFLFAMIALWIVAVRFLGVKFNEMTTHKPVVSEEPVREALAAAPVGLQEQQVAAG